MNRFRVGEGKITGQGVEKSSKEQRSDEHQQAPLLRKDLLTTLGEQDLFKHPPEAVADVEAEVKDLSLILNPKEEAVADET